jgi:hypothetical protein
MELFVAFASQLMTGVFVRPCILANCQNLFGFDRIKTGLYSFGLTRFLHANRFPLYSKTL